MANGDVFLAPADAAAFERTVRTPIELADYPGYPDALDDIEAVRLWGVPGGSNNQAYFEKMDAGDLVLFYEDGTYIGVGEVGRTFEDEDEWASTVWEDRSAGLLYTIEQFTPISVPKAAVNRIFDYNASYTPGGFMRVAEGRRSNTLAAIKRAVELYSEQSA